MKKTYILFQTTELSETGHKILVSEDNNLSEQDIISYFQKVEKIPSLNGIRLGNNMFCIEQETVQTESNRKSRNVLLIINSNISKLEQAQISELIKKANLFYSDKLPLLKKESESYTDEKYQNVIKSSIISSFENELTEAIPALSKVFVSSNINKKYIIGSCAAIIIIGIIVSIFVFQKKTQAYSKNNNDLFPQQTNVEYMNQSNQTSIVGQSTNANNTTTNQISSLNEHSQVSSLMNNTINGNKVSEPRVNDFALHLPDPINPFPGKTKNSKKNKRNDQNENQLVFIDEICNKYKLEKNTLISLLQNNTQWKDLNSLKPYEINELRNFLENAENVFFLGMEEKHKKDLKVLLNIKNEKLNLEYVTRCKTIISDFYNSWFKIYISKDTIIEYANLFKSYLKDERLDFVCYVINIQSDLNDIVIEDKESLPIFTETDYKKIIVFKQLMIGNDSIAYKFLKSNLMSELSIRNNISNSTKISEFLDIYQTKLKKLINTELSLDTLEKKLIEDFDNWPQERTEKFNTYQNSKEIRNLDFNTKVSNFVKTIINEKTDTSVLEEKLQEINQLYADLLNKIEKFGELK